MSTHCRHGHSFTEANTYVGTNGERRCRECRRVADRKRRDHPVWYPDLEERDAILSGRDVRKPEEIEEAGKILAKLVILIDRACDKRSPLPVVEVFKIDSNPGSMWWE